MKFNKRVILALSVVIFVLATVLYGKALAVEGIALDFSSTIDVMLIYVYSLSCAFLLNLVYNYIVNLFKRVFKGVGTKKGAAYEFIG